MVVENLLAQKFFKDQFSCFVTFDIMAGRHICLTRNCDLGPVYMEAGDPR